MSDLKALAMDTGNYVLTMRHQLHQNPRLRWEEDDVLALIEKECRRLLVNKDGVSFHQGKGGFLVDIFVNPKKTWLLFRADVDALPVQEATGLPFASKIPGMMHGCGHDIHAAMLLGFVKMIGECQLQLRHNLRLVFQRAEENPGSKPRPESGGDVLVNQDNVLDGISKAFALHIWEPGTPGVFYSRSGSFMANSDRLHITVKTSGGHVAMPNLGVNAARVTHAVMNMMEYLPGQLLGPMEPVSLEPAIIQAGTASNVMPAKAELWYSCRNFLPPEKRADFFNQLSGRLQILDGAFSNTQVTCELIEGHPALFNTQEEVVYVQHLLANAEEVYEEHERVLGGEDFAYYLQQKPGALVLLGANQPGCGGHHSPTFNPDESVFWKGVFFWLLLACY